MFEIEISKKRNRCPPKELEISLKTIKLLKPTCMNFTSFLVKCVGGPHLCTLIRKILLSDISINLNVRDKLIEVEQYNIDEVNIVDIKVYFTSVSFIRPHSSLCIITPRSDN